MISRFRLALVALSVTMLSAPGGSAQPRWEPSPTPLHVDRRGVQGQESNPQRERLARAIEQGEVDVVRAYLDNGGDANDAWRDTPAQIVRPLLVRSIWNSPIGPAAAGQEKIFWLLLGRGADPRSFQGFLQVPVRNGRVDVVRTLIARGVTPAKNEPVLLAALQSKSAPMVDLVLSAGIGVSVDPSQLQMYFLTNDITRLLVPKYLAANTRTPIGNEACDVLRILGSFDKHDDGCEGAIGPLWLHFVVTGNREIVAYLIGQGADLALRGEVPAGARPFTAMEIARARKDTRMIELLKDATSRQR